MTRKTVFVQIALLLFYTCVFSQAMQQEVLDQDWRIVPAMNNDNAFLSATAGKPFLNSYGGDFEGNRVMLSANETAVLVAFRRQEYGVIKLNSKLQIKWNTPLQGIPVKIVPFNGNLLVISSPDFKLLSGYVSQYDGTLIDAATGKIITRKRLFANENDFYCEPKFMLSPDGKTFRFGLRTSKLTRGVKFSFMGIGVNKMMDKAQQSNSVEVFTLNEKLEITKTVKLSIPEAYLFITCTINNRQEIVAASYDDNRNIFIEKYDAESGKLVTKQTVRVESRNNREFEPRLYTSKQNPDIAYLTIDYINQEKDKTLGIYRVDFASNKVSRNETIIDKPFRKDGEKQYVQVNEKAGKPDADDWRNLETRKVIEYNDKLIVCTEVVYMYRRDVIEPGTTHVSQGRPTWITGDVIVNILDKDLKPLSMQVVPKHNQLFTTVGACSSFYIRGNSLLLVGATDKGSGLHAVYAQVNIASGKLEKIEIMEKKDISKKDPPDPLATVWFEDGFVINYLDPDGFFVIKKISTSMQQVSYQ